MAVKMLCRAVFGLFLVLADRCLGGPIELPSSALNLPIEESAALADAVMVAIADTPLDHANEEHTFKEPRLYDFIQNTLASFINPTPIVDNLKEADKYGNDGDKLSTLGNLVVKGTEGATRLISTAVAVPSRILQAASTRTTDLLNRVGGAIVGI